MLSIGFRGGLGIDSERERRLRWSLSSKLKKRLLGVRASSSERRTDVALSDPHQLLFRLVLVLRTLVDLFGGFDVLELLLDPRFLELVHRRRKLRSSCETFQRRQPSRDFGWLHEFLYGVQASTMVGREDSTLTTEEENRNRT